LDHLGAQGMGWPNPNLFLFFGRALSRYHTAYLW